MSSHCSQRGLSPDPFDTRQSNRRRRRRRQRWHGDDGQLIAVLTEWHIAGWHGWPDDTTKRGQPLQWIFHLFFTRASTVCASLSGYVCLSISLPLPISVPLSLYPCLPLYLCISASLCLCLSIFSVSCFHKISVPFLSICVPLSPYLFVPLSLFVRHIPAAYNPLIY